MSHLKERQEKNCLNCNAQLQGKYCHICGQENVEAKETFWHLVSHFFQDITHFDGKFFSTLKLLIFNPGFLSREYMMGRRSSYLNPIKMYVFTSAFFFFMFFSFFNAEEEKIVPSIKVNGKTLDEVEKMDSTTFANYTKEINQKNITKGIVMSRGEFKKYADSVAKNSGFHLTLAHYKSKAEYDSFLATGVKKHYWWQKQLIYKEIDLNKKYHNNASEILQAFKHMLTHSLPQMLFISLPLFALLLKLLYVRRKNVYYIDHSIFSIHFYVFIFISMLLLFSLGKLNNQLHWGLITFLIGLLYLILFFYEYKALRNFYQQSRGKTIVKFLMLNVLFSITLLLLFIVFIFFSFFKI